MKKYVEYLPIVLSSITLIGFGYIIFDNFKDKEIRLNEAQIQEEAIVNLNNKITDLETVLLATKNENISFAEALKEAQEKSGKFAETISNISESVGTLEKISFTDKELLQKYSKVFFLNENYFPTNLRKIPEEYTHDTSREYEIHYDVWPYLRDLIDTAEKDGHELRIVSAFRSFGTQASLKSAYTVTYGAGSANQFSADQGYSEHQLGTTVDFTNTTLGARFSEFGDSKSYQWLLENAHRFGFVLSYPDGNSYYEFEPWHWRFVGEKLARDLYEDEKYFYDLSQREIDDYLVNFFD
jgi:LAS superfamily LD-carboxypeptidase LdcB